MADIEELAVARSGEVLRLTFNRPRAANALNAALQGALVDALARAAADDTVKAVLLGAAGGRVFSAGADLKEYSERPHEEAAALRRALLRASLLALADFSKPLVCMIHGKAIGGGLMLAMLADEVHAAEGAQFSLPEIRLGIPTPVGATLVAARAGRPAAIRLTQGGEAMEADAALSCGLIDGLHAADALESAALARAQALARHAGTAYAHNKRWINQALRADIVAALELAATLG